MGVVLFFLSFMVYFGVQGNSESVLLLASLLPTVAFANGVSVLSGFSSTNVPLVITTQYNNIAFSEVLIMQVVDMVLYTLLGAYLDQVLPKEWGTRQPLLFFLSPRYWGFKTKTVRKDAGEVDLQNLEFLEPISGELKSQETSNQALMLVGLEKHFQTPMGLKIAVKNLHINFYSGQITCLLG